MGTPIIPEEVLRTAFARRAAGERVASIARDLGLRKRYLASVLRGQDRPDLFVELGPTLGKRYLYAAELVAERTAPRGPPEGAAGKAAGGTSASEACGKKRAPRRRASYRFNLPMASDGRPAPLGKDYRRLPRTNPLCHFA